MLRDIAWLRVVGEAASGRVAAELIDAQKPDLVLLDIEMPGVRGLDILKQTAHQPYVIFTTAFAQHAVTAFELGALDYILKPFGAARLEKALDRARAALGEPRPPSTVLDRLSDVLAGPITRLFVRAGSAIIPVAVSSISWFEARGDYVAAHVPGHRHIINVSLNRLEERLDAKRFARIHRTHIINLDHVKAFRRIGGGKLEAELSDGTRLAVSRAKAQELKGLAR